MNELRTDPDEACITTRAVLDGAPAVRVLRDADDGCWQFLGAGDVSEEDARVVGYGTMLERDPTLAPIADLPPGWLAWRGGRGGAWQRRSRG